MQPSVRAPRWLRGGRLCAGAASLSTPRLGATTRPLNNGCRRGWRVLRAIGLLRHLCGKRVWGLRLPGAASGC